MRGKPYEIKIEIRKEKKLIYKGFYNTSKISNSDLNKILFCLFDKNIKYYGDGIYSKLSEIIEQKFKIKLTEDAIRKRIEKSK